MTNKCPRCGKRLKYNSALLGDLGGRRAVCRACGFDVEAGKGRKANSKEFKAAQRPDLAPLTKEDHRIIAAGYSLRNQLKLSFIKLAPVQPNPLPPPPGGQDRILRTMPIWDTETPVAESIVVAWER